MANNTGRSWSSIASQGLPPKPPASSQQIAPNTTASSTGPPRQSDDAHKQKSQPQQHRLKRSPSPSHKFKTESTEDNVYVLTLATDKRHHKTMTDLRNQYFPKKINKLAAHLTLFHALPGSKLDSIKSHIESIASSTQHFKVHAAKPFLMKKGIAISVSKFEGGEAAQDIHRKLQQKWSNEGFLSEQDAGGMRVHYTIMNKVDDQGEVERAFKEVEGTWKGDWGSAEGLGLYRYDRGFWRFERMFGFGGGGGGEGV